MRFITNNICREFPCLCDMGNTMCNLLLENINNLLIVSFVIIGLNFSVYMLKCMKETEFHNLCSKFYMAALKIGIRILNTGGRNLEIF